MTSHRMGGGIVNHKSDIGLFSTIHKNSQNSITGKQIAKDLSRYFIKEDIGVAKSTQKDVQNH